MSDLKKVIKDISEWAAIADTLVNEDSLIAENARLNKQVDLADGMLIMLYNVQFKGESLPPRLKGAIEKHLGIN